MPKESKQEGTLLENEENENKNETRGCYHSAKKSVIGENNDSNYNECDDANRFVEGNLKENNQCPFEMIDDIAKTMKKIGKQSY